MTYLLDDLDWYKRNGYIFESYTNSRGEEMILASASPPTSHHCRRRHFLVVKNKNKRPIFLRLLDFIYGENTTTVFYLHSITEAAAQYGDDFQDMRKEYYLYGRSYSYEGWFKCLTPSEKIEAMWSVN